MKKHLFIEGPVQSGKSTLLRQLLKPYMPYIGGFAGQRLITPDGKTRAHRIGSASSTSLTAEFDDSLIKNLDGVFRITEDDGSVSKFPEVFEHEGIKYITENQGKKLLLLDEIGGVELLNPAFRKCLYQTLNGKLPCIGVIKLNRSADHMATTSDYPMNVVAYNNELRKKITEEYDGRIIKFSRNDSEVTKIISEFLREIFITK